MVENASILEPNISYGDQNPAKMAGGAVATTPAAVSASPSPATAIPERAAATVAVSEKAAAGVPKTAVSYEMDPPPC